MSRTARLSTRRAKAHEALVARVDALIDQVRPLAAKHPEAAVTQTLSCFAQTCLNDLAWFDRTARQTPAADWTGLLAQLTQARAFLDTFEALHSAWDKDNNARVWILRRGRVHIRRLRPLSTKPPRSQDNPESRRIRALMEQRINAITKGLPLD
jgi:hypothetical protein